MDGTWRSFAHQKFQQLLAHGVNRQCGQLRGVPCGFVLRCSDARWWPNALTTRCAIDIEFRFSYCTSIQYYDAKATQPLKLGQSQRITLINRTGLRVRCLRQRVGCEPAGQADGILMRVALNELRRWKSANAALLGGPARTRRRTLTSVLNCASNFSASA